jgi:hypothetical protein
VIVSVSSALARIDRLKVRSGAGCRSMRLRGLTLCQSRSTNEIDESSFTCMVCELAILRGVVEIAQRKARHQPVLFILRVNGSNWPVHRCAPSTVEWTRTRCNLPRPRSGNHSKRISSCRSPIVSHWKLISQRRNLVRQNGRADLANTLGFTVPFNVDSQ